MTLALFGSINVFEVMVVLIVAIVIFGKDLPRVAARGAVQFTRFRRTLQRMWRETGIEQEIRDVEAEIRSAVPRDVNPSELARLATENIERQLEDEGSGQKPSERRSDEGPDAAKEPAPGDGSETPSPGSERREPA